MNEIESAKIWMANLLMDDEDFPDALLNDTLKRVYTDHAEMSKGFPYVLINLMSGIDQAGLGTNRIQTRADFLVRVVSNGSPTTDSRDVESWFDALLQTQVAQVAGDYIITCRRLAPFNRTEYDASKARFSHGGGIYRTFIYRSP
jgi:hypothetical protein